MDCLVVDEVGVARRGETRLFVPTGCVSEPGEGVPRWGLVVLSFFVVDI
jgi:hypothetical protein